MIVAASDEEPERQHGTWHLAELPPVTLDVNKGRVTLDMFMQSMNSFISRNTAFCSLHISIRRAPADVLYTGNVMPDTVHETS